MHVCTYVSLIKRKCHVLMVLYNVMYMYVYIIIACTCIYLPIGTCAEVQWQPEVCYNSHHCFYFKRNCSEMQHTLAGIYTLYHNIWCLYVLWLYSSAVLSYYIIWNTNKLQYNIYFVIISRCTYTLTFTQTLLKCSHKCLWVKMSVFSRMLTVCCRWAWHDIDLSELHIATILSI